MKQITCDACGAEVDADILKHAALYVIGGRTEFPRLDYCHDCAAALCEVIENFSDGSVRPESPKQKRAREDSEMRERWAAWRATAGEQRQRLILEALSSDRLSVGQIAARLTERHRDEFGRIFDSTLRSEVRNMLVAGELDRTRDDCGKRLRYLYFRKPGLSGPIADLEALLDHESEG